VAGRLRGATLFFIPRHSSSFGVRDASSLSSVYRWASPSDTGHSLALETMTDLTVAASPSLRTQRVNAILKKAGFVRSVSRKTPVKGFASHSVGYRARKWGDGVIRIDQEWGGWLGFDAALQEDHLTYLSMYARALRAAGLLVGLEMGGGGICTAYLVVARTADKVTGKPL